MTQPVTDKGWVEGLLEAQRSKERVVALARLIFVDAIRSAAGPKNLCIVDLPVLARDALEAAEAFELAALEWEES